jgi:hypothetical protein
MEKGDEARGEGEPGSGGEGGPSSGGDDGPSSVWRRGEGRRAVKRRDQPVMEKGAK